MKRSRSWDTHLITLEALLGIAAWLRRRARASEHWSEWIENLGTPFQGELGSPNYYLTPDLWKQNPSWHTRKMGAATTVTRFLVDFVGVLLRKSPIPPLVEDDFTIPEAVNQDRPHETEDWTQLLNLITRVKDVEALLPPVIAMIISQVGRSEEWRVSD